MKWNDVSNTSAQYTKSDKNLKKDLTKIGKILGITVYTWSWNDVAMSTYCLHGREVGLLAQDLPSDVVVPDAYGYLEIRPDTWAAKMMDKIRVLYPI